MEFLGIGITELLAILVIVFLVMGPRDLVKIGGNLGRALHKFRNSEAWRAMQDASRQLREFPETLVRQAGLDELENDLREQKQALRELEGQFSAWTRSPDPLSQKTQTPKDPAGGDSPAEDK